MASAIDAGRAVLKLLLDDQDLEKGFANMQRKLRNTGRQVRSVGLGIGAAGAAITAPLAVATKQFIDLGDQLDKTAARTGVSVQALSELKFAAEQSGAGIEEVEKAFFGMSRALFDASRGSAEAVESLEKIGLSVDELQGLNPEQQFEKIAAALRDVEDASTRGAIAQRLFGRAGRQILPLIDSMGDLRQEARDLGITMDTETAKSAAALLDAFNRVKTTLVAVSVQIGAALAPALVDLLDWLQPIVRSVVEWVKENDKLVILVAAVGGGLTALGATLAGLGLAISATATGLGALSTTFTLLSANPFVLTITAAVGVVYELADAIGILNGELKSFDQIAISLGQKAGLAPGVNVGDLRQFATPGEGGATGAAAPPNSEQLSADQQKIREQVELAAAAAASQQVGAAVANAAPAQATDVDRGILDGVKQLDVVLGDILTELQNRRGFIVGNR